MVSLPKGLQQVSISKALLLVVLLLLVGVGAVPGYINSDWRWLNPPQVQALKQLRLLKKQGLEVADWQVLNHQALSIGGRGWSSQELILQDQKPVPPATFVPNKAALLLLPQVKQTDQPQVEWTDIRGWQRWTEDSNQTLQFSLDLSDVAQPTTTKMKTERRATVKARFFRGWTEQQTFAVMQWYAFPAGGSPSPGRWFWADRIAQWKQQRVPWVAVCILLPIDPFGEIENYQAPAQSLAAAVQQALVLGPFQADT
jgi:cyanoexosortase B-associated protein